MRRWYTLFHMEYARLFPPLCVIIGLMAALEMVLFGVTSVFWENINVPLAFHYDGSGVPFVFFAAFAALTMVMALRFAPARSLYALFTLPVPRSHVYLAKLAAGLLASLCIIAVQMGLLLVFSAWSPGIRNAALYLALLDSWFLRAFFPPEPFSLAFSLSVWAGMISLVPAASTYGRAGKVHTIIGIMAVWLLLVAFSFPVTQYKLLHSVIKLVLLAAFPIAVSMGGVRLFTSGEAAR